MGWTCRCSSISSISTVRRARGNGAPRWFDSLIMSGYVMVPLTLSLSKGHPKSVDDSSQAGRFNRSDFVAALDVPTPSGTLDEIGEIGAHHGRKRSFRRASGARGGMITIGLMASPAFRDRNICVLAINITGASSPVEA